MIDIYSELRHLLSPTTKYASFLFVCSTHIIRSILYFCESLNLAVFVTRIFPRPVKEYNNIYEM